MGSGSSFLGNDDDILGNEYDGSQGVIKRIPIEVKPRGRLGLRSVRSLGKSKGGSTRSALSVELENPDVERIRREFEMYRLNNENEVTGMQKRVQKLETENRRLRAELKTLQKTCRKLREERDAAVSAEHQAMARAAAFEGDRDKVQRNFKIYRETTESEVQNILRAKRDLEVRLTKVGQEICDEVESGSRIEALGGNPGDWWTALESEPSLGSTTQLHHPTFLRDPEITNTFTELQGPFVNVNKDDWMTAAATLSKLLPSLSEEIQPNVKRVFISSAVDTTTESTLLIQDYSERLSKLCMSEGHFLLLVYMPVESSTESSRQSADRLVQARYRQIDRSTIFLAFLREQTDRYTESDVTRAHLCNPGHRPTIFCFAHSNPECAEISQLRRQVLESSGARVIDDYQQPEQGTQLAFKELEKQLRTDLGLSKDEPVWQDDTDESDPQTLCGGGLWDANHEYEQHEAWIYAKNSTCQLGFEKHYEKLNIHQSAPGPLPPMLVTGSSGSGRSLLLAKWLDLQRQRTGGALVLYHFVGQSTTCAADPVILIRRLTQKLMQHVTTPPPLTSDPVRLMEEFPRWLDKVSSRLSVGITLVLDGLDRIQNVETHFRWLLDPLPVDLRVFVSADVNSCPQPWKSWPSMHLEELSNCQIRDLLRAELASQGRSLASEEEQQVLTHCRSPPTCSPLYVILLASEIARCSSEEMVAKRLDKLLTTSDTVQLYLSLLEQIQHEFDNSTTRIALRKVLRFVYAARNGVSEAEILQLLPRLCWNQWAPLCDSLCDCHILTYRSGLLVFAHSQAKQAVKQRYVDDRQDRGSKTLNSVRTTLRDYFGKFTMPGELTYRVADELPWLNRQLEDMDQLRKCVKDLCLFVKLYGRGRSGELIGYWQYLGEEKATMAQSYFSTAKLMEGMVDQYPGFVTLPRIADVYEALGRFLRDLGLLAEALTPLQRALEIRETALDPDHPSVAHTLHQMANLHAQWAKFPTAELLYKQALEIYEGALGNEHHLVAKELDALAVLYQKQSKLDLAEPLRKRAVSIRRTLRIPPGASSPSRDKRPAVCLEELSLGADSPELARTLNEIGVLYYLQNNTQHAESFFHRSLEMREALLGADHTDVAQSLNNLAGFFCDKHNYEKAQPLYERALQIRRKHHAVDHPSVVSIIKHLAMLYKKMGNLDKAEPLYQELADLMQKNMGANHPSVATALVNLAVLLSQQGKLNQALPLYKRALKIYEESLGVSHPRVAETLKNLARLKYDQGDLKMAAKLYRRSTDIRDTATNDKPAERRSSSADTTSTLQSGKMHIKPVTESENS